MANKSKQLTKEEVLEVISALSFEDQIALHKSLTEEIQTEANRRIDAGHEAASALSAINGKK